VSPKNNTARTTTTDVSRRKAGQSSTPVGSVAVRRCPGRSRIVVSRVTRITTMTSAGTMSNTVPRSPARSRTGAVINDPSAKPALPPRANTLMARLLLPAACRAARAASGWKAAMPSPDNAMTSQVSR